MVNTKLNLSMTEPYVRQIYAKEGDTGRVLEIGLEDYPTENGTLRILRPDGVEVTADAIKSAGGDAYKGDLVTFDALEEVPLTKCEVTLEPVQDLHGQSSPYPSGGGKNKVDIPQNALHQTDYTVPYYYNIIPTTPYALTADQTYTVSFDYEITGTTTKPNFTVGLGSGTNYATDLVSKTSIDTSGRLEFSFTPTSAQLSTYQYVAFRFPRYSSSKTVSWTISNFQLELGDHATSYAPYSNICPIEPSNDNEDQAIYVYHSGEDTTDYTAYPLSLGQNVYGGKVDLVSGKLVVDRAYMTVGTSGWTYYSPYLYIIKDDKVTPSLGDTTYPLMCSMLPYGGCNYASRFPDMSICQSANKNIYLKDSSCASANEFYAKYKDAEIVYYLATPIEVDLTPTQITTLLGENNVWSSGEVEVAFEYDGLFAQLPQQATEVVGRCIGDVDFNGASTMPFTLVVKPNNKENT